MTREHDVESSDDEGVSRRGFMARGLATGLVAGGLTTAALAQTTGEDVRTFALDGVVEAWQGIAPASISGEDNPTLELTAGETYRVVWLNGDGEPHNFAFQDADGNNLEVIRPLPVTADQVTVFDNETVANATNLTWSDAVTGEAVNATGNATMGNETMGNATDGGDGDLVSVTDLVEEEGGVQALEFEATEEMATYICTIHPTTMVGDVSVSGGGTGNETGNSS